MLKIQFRRTENSMLVHRAKSSEDYVVDPVDTSFALMRMSNGEVAPELFQEAIEKKDNERLSALAQKAGISSAVLIQVRTATLKSRAYEITSGPAYRFVA